MKGEKGRTEEEGRSRRTKQGVFEGGRKKRRSTVMTSKRKRMRGKNKGNEKRDLHEVEHKVYLNDEEKEKDH